MTGKGTWGPVRVAAILVVSLACGGAWAAADEVGQPAPALVVRGLDGAQWDLASLRGKVVVLNLWASWCIPCRAEMPMLDTFGRQHLSDGVVVLGLSADDVHDRREVAKAMRNLNYPAALLQEAQRNGFGMPKVLPVTYVIDTQGVIRARLMPTRAGLTAAQLEAAVQGWLTPRAAL